MSRPTEKKATDDEKKKIRKIFLTTFWQISLEEGIYTSHFLSSFSSTIWNQFRDRKILFFPSFWILLQVFLAVTSRYLVTWIAHLHTLQMPTMKFLTYFSNSKKIQIKICWTNKKIKKRLNWTKVKESFV